MASLKIELPASKSISNRLLLINALSGNKLKIINLSQANDTVVLNQILSAQFVQTQTPLRAINVHDAGTVMRFLTAYYSIKNGQWLLQGTLRMHQRPIHILVDTLTQLGAKISYAENEGFPPLLITGKPLQGGKISVQANISSQYISALLLIAPYLKNGLQLQLMGKIASLPYIQMTAGLMRTCGAIVAIQENTITVEEGEYTAQKLTVENDWSAASYWYAFVALSEGLEIELSGVKQNSLQGDSIVALWMENFGVNTSFYTDRAVLKKSTQNTISYFEQDFSPCPDLAPTFICLCAAMGIAAKFTGLESLAIKESDRTQALANELGKLGVKFIQKNEYWELTPNNNLNAFTTPIVFDTYGDHRLAMALAMFKLLLPNITINTPEVVKKSYPHFWDDFFEL